MAKSSLSRTAASRPVFNVWLVSEAKNGLSDASRGSSAVAL
jgi:hypothetical protein